ncbi:hypothetical protein OS493_008552 [Desmophyllum pertusum]|uniref:Fibronectin type-III domain-containing protein n=1 Tax=Desmophyllum pertusum TaxID=174260 RepID=A0A9X0D3Y8_9CNID|nr:hypothetical protein OS493_008552 [Desmophyllum pertusum]
MTHKLLFPRYNENQVQLSIINTTASEDAGNYTCLVINDVGNSSDTTSIVIQVVPDPPFNVTVDSKSSRVVNISWMAGFDGNSVILDYTVKISEDNQNLTDVVCQGSLTSASLVNLFPSTTYNIRVFARNLIGKSTGSSVVNAITDEEVPSAAPTFNVTVVNSTAVIVSWQMLTKEQARGAILGYYLSYKTELDNDVWVNRTVDGGNITSYLVTSLKKFTSYKFVMQAFNSKGASPQSAAVVKKTDQDIDALQANLTGLVKNQDYRIRVLASTIKGDGNYSDPPLIDQTNQDKPGAAPENLKGRNLTSTSILVTWGEVPADKQHGHIRHYTVIYKKVSGGPDKTKIVTIKRAELEGLDKFSEYNIRVLAATIKGDGPPSDPIVVSTDEDKPSAAPSLTVVKTLNSTSIQVEWEPVPPQNRLGHITKYVIIIYTDGIEERKMDVPAPASKAIVNGLKQSTTYTVKILAATVKGNGPPSDPKTATTKGEENTKTV